MGQTQNQLMESFLQATKQMQDALGDLNDVRHARSGINRHFDTQDEMIESRIWDARRQSEKAIQSMYVMLRKKSKKSIPEFLKGGHE